MHLMLEAVLSDAEEHLTTDQLEMLDRGLGLWMDNPDSDALSASAKGIYGYIAAVTNLRSQG